MARMLSHDRSSGPLRLLWLIDSLTLGGAERLTAEFARAVDPSRVRLTVCALKRIGQNPFERAVGDTGIPAVQLESRGLRDIGAFRKLRALAVAERFDLVHAHLTDASIWGALLGRLTGTPVVATLHVAPNRAPAWSRWGVRERLMCAVLRRWSATVLAVSAAQRDMWLRAGRFAPEHLTVVYNGIDVAEYEPRGNAAAERAEVRRALGVAEGAPVAMTIAALRGSDKGIDVLLTTARDVLGAVPGARIVIVGGGPLESLFREAARDAGIDDGVIFTGMRRDTSRLLHAADLFVLPSRLDAFPTVLLEAMAAGLPVVASAVGGVSEIVDDASTGRLVASGDPAALAQAMVALRSDRETAMALGRAGRARVRTHFSISPWLGRLQRVYEGALDRPPGVLVPAVEAS